MDLILLLELAIYSFHHDSWAKLSATNPWRNIVKRSERLMLTHFRSRLDEYFQIGDAANSWLAHQCNRSGWDPRPQ